MKKRILLLFSLSFFWCRLQAQDITGLWQGYITATDASVTSGYLIDVENQQDDMFSGRAYIFRDGIFDGHLDFIGTVADSAVRLTELRVLEYRTPPSWFVCVKFCYLDLLHRKNIDHLTGHWEGSIFSGVACTPGDVILRRFTPDNPDGIQPVPEQVALAIKKNAGKPMTFLKTELDKPVVIAVKNRVVQFELRDYMREDNDTVSVYFNRNLLLEKQRISKRKKTFTVRLDRFSELNEFIVYAENLGDVPPNTCTLSVIDGGKRTSVSIVSTRETSAVIYLRYQPEIDRKADRSR